MYIQVILSDSFSGFYQKIRDVTHDFVLVKEAHSQGEFYMSVYASVQAYVAVFFACRACKTTIKVRWSTAEEVLCLCWHEHG